MDAIKVATERRTIKVVAAFNMYTDGSASGGLLDVSAGVVVTRETQLRLKS